MKVRCDRIVDAVGRPAEESRWLTIGHEYLVLEVTADAADRVLLRLIGDDRTVPGLHEAGLFATVSSTVPSTWTAAVHDGGRLHLGPERWRSPGFWERYFDYEPEAVAVFREELDSILSELPVGD